MDDAAVLLAMLSTPITLNVAGATSEPPSDWSTSPEAIFITREELQAWRMLAGDEERQQFQSSYWKRRDPDQSTPTNEFENMARARIQGVTGDSASARESRVR
jgi:hypothetical protein